MENFTEQTPPSKLAPPEIIGERAEKVVSRKADSLKSSLAYLKRRTSAELIRITKPPEDFRAVLLLVDEIDKAKGVLRLSGKLTPALLCLIMMHRKFDKIRKIVLENFTPEDLDEFEVIHKTNISRFKELFGISVPKEVIYYANFCHQVNAAFDDCLLGPKSSVYLYGYQGLCGIWGKVFSTNVLSESDILTDRHGHHELSYFPMFHYGSDGVSHGLVFDYQTNSFSGIAYYGDGEYGGCSQIMDHLVKYALYASESSEDVIPANILDSLDKNSNFLDFCTLAEEIKYEMLPWFIALAASGYVSELTLSVPRPKPASMVRYGYSNALVKQKLEKKGLYFVEEMYPACVVNLNNVTEKRFKINKKSEIDKALLDTIFYNMALGEFDSYRLVKFLIANERLDLVTTVRGEFSLTFDKDGYLTQKSDDEMFEFQVRLAEKQSRDGYHELAFCLVFALWNMGTEQSTEYALRLAEIIPNDVLHPIVKIMVIHHAKTRFDRFIMR